MNRRKFLNLLGANVAVASTASPFAVFLKSETDAEYYHRRRAEIPKEKRGDLIGSWVSYKFHYSTIFPTNYRTNLPVVFKRALKPVS